MNSLTLPFDSFGVTHKGCVRELNEDNYLMDPEGGLWAVADGVGGHEAGEVASASIVDHLGTVGVATSAADLRARFEDRLTKAHQDIRKIAAERGVIIGSTIAALLAIDGRFACLWSGDSRVYLVRGGSITQVSRDHTEVQELLDRGVINEQEAASWPRKNVVTRAVGANERLAMDFQHGETYPDDIFVLCSDGLTAHVNNSEIREAVVANPPQAACETLLGTVLSRGGTDNVTIVVVSIRNLRNGDANLTRVRPAQ